jgi:glycosyltransferase involved in cell wall biosynthesis
MKIRILNWRDPKHPLAGGAEQSLLNHAKYWKRKGAIIEWFASREKGLKTYETLEGINIFRKGSHYTVHMHAFREKRKAHEADIIIDCFHFVPFFTPFYAENKKIVALINEPAKEAWFKNIFFPASLIGYTIEPLFFKAYYKVPFVTSANSIKKELRLLGITDQKIVVIPHGVTIPKSKNKEKKEKHPTILYLSQISPDKGIEDAIEAIRRIQKQKTNVNFWVAGKPISNVYERKIKKLLRGLKNVKFLGFVSESQKAEILQKAWVLIHPSLREGWGLNVIEANYFGTPAIGYNVTGLRDSIQNNRTGLVTTKNTPEELAKKFEELVDNSDKYQRLSKNAKIWAEEFTWDKAGKKSWDLIQKIYEKNKK